MPPIIRHCDRRRLGSILIVTLFMVVLLTILIVAFLDQSLLHRQISFTSAGQYRAQRISQAAIGFIESDILSEIANGSDTTGSNGYRPTTNWTMVPYRSGTIAGAPTLIKWSAAGQKFWVKGAHNLPAGNSDYAADGPIRSGSNSTLTPSANGRMIPQTRWDASMLSSTSITALVSSMWAPDWVLVTRQGLLSSGDVGKDPTQLPDLADPSKDKYVIGRYAYAIHDLGGLVDITAAGFPASLTVSGTDSNDLARKGNIGFADLTSLGLTTTQINNLIAWRNASTSSGASSAANYIDYLVNTASKTGFLNTAPGDHAFVSRQDFIQTGTSTLGLTRQQIAGFTTFSREVNAPCWGPTHDASDSVLAGSNSGYAGDGSATAYSDEYKYRTNATGTTTAGGAIVYNRFFPSVRVSGTFKRLNGQTAIAGEPLVVNRFDLSKLSWITHNNASKPSGVSNEDIYNYFGLTYGVLKDSDGSPDGSWFYSHTSQTYTPGSAAKIDHIMTLDEVAKTGREPDFFELLQAGILRGSLGQMVADPSVPASWNSTSGNVNGEYGRLLSLTDMTHAEARSALCRTDLSKPAGYPQLVHATEMYHVLQIGANMIDQADTDSFSTDIACCVPPASGESYTPPLNAEHFYGIENLPYINSLYGIAVRPPPTDPVVTPNTNQAYIHHWLSFALWNPHQNAMVAPCTQVTGTSSTETAPAKLRIYVPSGDEHPEVLFSTTVAQRYLERRFTADTSSTTSTLIEGPAWISFKINDYSSTYFATPTMLDPNHASVTPDSYDSNNSNALGLYKSSFSGGWQRAGIYLGWAYAPENHLLIPACDAAFWAGQTHDTEPPFDTTTGFPPTSSGGVRTRPSDISFSMPLNIFLQYWDSSSSKWRTYQQLRSLAWMTFGNAFIPYLDPGDPSVSSNASNLALAGSKSNPGGQPSLTDSSTFNLFIDPRTDRFNLFTPSLRPPNGATDMTLETAIVYSTSGGPTGPHFGNQTGQGSNMTNMKGMVNNMAGTANSNGSSYSDRDFVVRRGDAAGWSGADPLVSPKIDTQAKLFSPPAPTTTALAARPLMLDRPFRSVGEIGYTFRDDPWKSLNMVSNKSADAGLLDIFTVATSSTIAPPTVVAGKININSATAPVLQAIIKGAARTYNSINPTNVDTIISPADASALASSIVNTISTSGPLFTIADMTSLFPQDATTPTGQPGNKASREALVRALADSAQARTWNLLIDITAQSGRYSRNAKTLDKFIVEGEKHYWLHLAIDRFTGQIVDQQLESVAQW